jgi:DNA-binding beta-propeller fold protein YncE
MAFSATASRTRWLATTGALAFTLALGLVPGTASAKSLPAPTSTKRAAASSGATNVPLDGQAGGLAVDPDTDTAYTVVSGTTLEVIDLATGTVTATVRIGSDLHGMAVDPDTDTVYVLDYGTSSLLVISGATNAVTATITGLGTLSEVDNQLAVNPVTDTIYVGLNSASSAVDVIDGATNTITATIPGDSDADDGFGTSIAVDTATDMIYAIGGSGSADTVLVINGATNSVINSINLGDDSYQGYATYGPLIAVDPATDIFYVTNSNDTLTSYSGATNALLGTVSVSPGNGPANGLIVNPDTNTVYTADGDLDFGILLLIDGATDTVTGNINLPGPTLIDVDPDTDTVVGIVPADSELAIIALQAPSISSAASTTFDADQNNVFSFAATGTPDPTFSETGTLPAGVTWNINGVLLGTPAPQAVGSYPITVTAANGVAPAATQTFTLLVAPTLYTPIGPLRLLDTRTGLGAVPARADLTVQIPSFGATTAMSAVALNVTAISPTANGNLTVFTAAGAGATTSNIAFSAGQTVAGLVTVAPSDGAVTIQNNSAGTVQVAADLDGYYSSAGAGFQGATPVRVMDTRSDLGSAGPVPSKGVARLNLSGHVPAGATAAVLNLTATGPTAAGDIIAYADGQQVPGTSNLNFSAGQTVANQVIVPLTNGIADFYNASAGKVQLIADLSGYYAPGAPGSFVPYGPTRIVDTRIGLGVAESAIPAGGTLLVPASALHIYSTCSAANCSPLDQADVLNVTVTAPRAAGFLTVYPTGQSLPATSSVNFTAGRTVADPVVVQDLNQNGFAIHNSSTGTVQVVVDEEGYFLN